MSDTTAFELVTPARVLMAYDASMVVAPGSEGLFGVLPRHAPMIANLKRGIVEVFDKGQIVGRIMVDGGVADVTATQCTILAERAEKLEATGRDALQTRLHEAEAAGDDAEADFIRASIEAI